MSNAARSTPRISPISGTTASIGPPQLAAEDLRQLVFLLVRRRFVDEDANAPIPIGHHLRRIGDCDDLMARHIGASTTLSLMLKASVTRLKALVVPCARAASHGQIRSHESASTYLPFRSQP